MELDFDRVKLESDLIEVLQKYGFCQRGLGIQSIMISLETNKPFEIKVEYKR